MAQFDLLITFSLLCILVLAAYYRLSIETLIPQFAGVGKFREKKLNFNRLNRLNSYILVIFYNILR